MPHSSTWRELAPSPPALKVLERLGLRPDPLQLYSIEESSLALARERALSVEALFERCLSEPLTGELVNALAERLSVGESTFFRHPAHFAALEHVLLPALRPGRTGLKVLSAGCARGEEPYSLAITLARAWPQGLHRVLGLDVSGAMLALARQARFRPWSLRGNEPEALAPWLTPQEDGWVVGSEALRQKVSFLQGNLLELPPELERAGPFDLIFCRNVLIYFTARAGRAVAAGLSRLLAPGGYLVVGPADHDFCDGLTPCTVGEVHLYQAPAAPALEAPLGPAAAPRAPRILTPPAVNLPLPAEGPPVEPKVAVKEYETLLAEGRKSRDAGQAEEALRRFDQAISLLPERPEAFFEQALLLDAKGILHGARALLERVLYLDACFVPALVVLARILMRTGHRSRARSLLLQLDAALADLPPLAPLPSWQEMNAGSLQRSCRFLLSSAAVSQERA